MKLNQEQFPTYKSLLPVQFIPTISELYDALDLSLCPGGVQKLTI